MRIHCWVIREDLDTAVIGGSITETSTIFIEDAEIWRPETQIYHDTLYIISYNDLEDFQGAGKTAPYIITGCPAEYQKALDLPGKFLIAEESVTAGELCHTIRRILHKYSDWYQRMLDAVISRKGYQAVLDIAYEQLKNPLALFDTSWFCLAISGRDQVPPDDVIWKEILSSGHVSVDLSPVIKKNRSVFDKKNKRAAYRLSFQIGKKTLPYLRANIFLKKELVGSICFTEIESPITARTEALAAQVCEIFSLMYHQMPVSPNNEKSLQSLFIRMLHGEKIKEAYLDNLLQKINWDLQDQYCLYVISLEQTLHETSYVLRNLGYYFNNSQTLILDKQLILIHNVSKSVIYPPNEIERLLTNLDLYAGASVKFHSFQNLRYYYVQAEHAAASGNICSPEKRIFHFEEIEIYHIMRTLDTDGTLISYCMPEILQLAKKDNSELSLVHTLYVYLSCGKNLIESAAKMGLHRNTLVYRVQKINSIIGSTIYDQTDGMLKVLLSCAILLYLSTAPS